MNIPSDDCVVLFSLSLVLMSASVGFDLVCAQGVLQLRYLPYRCDKMYIYVCVSFNSNSVESQRLVNVLSGSNKRTTAPLFPLANCCFTLPIVFKLNETTSFFVSAT